MVAKIETNLVYKRREILTEQNSDLKDTITTHTLLNNNNNNNNDDENIKEILKEDDYEGVLPASIGTDYTFKRKVVWFNAIGFLILHIAGIFGILLMFAGYAKLPTVIYSLLFTTISAMGITMGAHRLYSHRSFKAKTWLRITLIIMQTIVGQNCLYVWVRDHRQHHKYSDTDADPHNANRGFFFSHIGWLMSKKHPKVIEYGKKIDMSDLEADKWVMLQKEHYKKLYFLFTMLIPTLIPCVLWGEDFIISFFVTFLARTVTQLNFTWSVNSIAHKFGNKPYDKNLLPVESKLVAILAAGEGWHNYHHTFPWDYRTSEIGMPWNLTTVIIDWLADRGHIYDRKFVSESMLKSRILRTGDGTHKKYGINAMPREISESDLLASLNENEISTTITTTNTQKTSVNTQDPLRKYIIDKKQLNTNMLDKLESCGKIDGMNNNDMNDMNGNMEKGKVKNIKMNSKEMLNVST